MAKGDGEMNKLPIPKSFAIFGDSIGRGVMYDPNKDSYDTNRGFVSMLEKRWGRRSLNFTRFGQTVSKGLKMNLVATTAITTGRQ